MTDYVITPDGDHEVQVTYPDGTATWITVPAAAAGLVDPVQLAEVAKPAPPATLPRARGQVAGDQGAEDTGR